MQIKFKSAGWVKWLDVETVDHVLNRQAVVMPLPGIPGTGLPLAFSIDMGSMSQDIVLRGVIKDEDPLHAYGAASWRDLRHMVIRGWKDLALEWSDPFNPQGAFRIGYYLQIGGQVWYRTVPMRLELTREGGKGYWNFSLTLSVLAWPPTTYEV